MVTPKDSDMQKAHADIRKEPIAVTGIWLDAHSGRILVRAEFAGAWHTVIDETDNQGHISHIVEPAGMIDKPESPELKE